MLYTVQRLLPTILVSFISDVEKKTSERGNMDMQDKGVMNRDKPLLACQYF